MASGEDDLAEAVVAPGARRQRPPATIELTAQEVAAEPGAAPSGEAADPAAAIGSVDPPGPNVAEAVAPSHPEPGHATGGAAEPPPKAPQPIDGVPRRRRGGLLAFASVGAGIAVIAVALTWLAGAFTTRDLDYDILNAQIGRLDMQMRDLARRSVIAADQKTADEFAARLDALGEGLRRLDAIEARVAKQEAAAQAPLPATPDPAQAGRLAATEAKLGALAGTLADLRKRIDAVAEKAATTPAVASPPADTGAIEALAGRVAALEKAVKATDDKVIKSAAAAHADAPVRLALVALELRVAVERGVPFATELAAAKPLVADKSVLAALEPAAAHGVPTVQALSRELANVAPAMLRAAGTPHEGGLIDRLQANAERLVRIRPIAEAPGSDPSTVIVRAEVKATRGDLAGALAEISGLPADVKAPAAQWIKSAEMRIAAVAAAQKFSVSALEALGKSSP